MLGNPSSSYSVGNRVYNGGLPHPTSGTVDPSGYISRSLNQSNRRSGLAQTALRMQQRFTQPIKPESNPVMYDPGTHTVQTSPTGKLQLVPLNQPATPPSTSPTDQSNVLPFDAQTAAQQLLLQKQNSDFMDNLQQKEQQLGETTTTAERNVDLSAPGKFRSLLNNYAARGMANSSGYGYQYGITADDIANQKADLERQLQEGLANYQLQAQQQADNYNMQLGQLQTTGADNMALTPDQIAGLAGAQLPTNQPPTAPAKKAVPPFKKSTGSKAPQKKAIQAAAQRLVAKKTAATKKPPVIGKK